MITSLLSTLSAVAVGLMSGLYWAFTVVVMPSLRANDDRSFIAFMQTTNQVTISIWFLPVFVGSLLLPIAAAIAALLAGDNDDAKRWAIAGAILAAIPVAITAGGNAPLNLALDRAGDVDSIGDPASVRRAFEGPWTRFNLWRTITSTAALFALIRA
ncbi:MAG: DUF1772 domain-containing protein, partial [Pyrinomonadaceae bacterium]